MYDTINLEEFPVTRFQGSKRKIIPWIHQVLQNSEINFHTSLDGFGGSASVSYLFKKMGKEVHYNDKLRFNSIIGKALIENSDEEVSECEIDEILAFESTSNFIAKTFQDIYFLDDENVWLDNVIGGIEMTFSKYRQISSFKKDICYYAVFQACLMKRPFNLFHRRNLSLRTNEVERGFGNKTTWEQPFEGLFRKFVKEAHSKIFDSGIQCLSMNKSIFEIDSYGYDLVYLDPPYFSQLGSHETSDYERCYHFLEGMTHYNDWRQSIDYKSTNLRYSKSGLPPELNSGNALEKFEELIEKFASSTIVLSYKMGGLPSISFLVKLLKKFKTNVYTTSIPYQYALANKATKRKQNREVLLIGYNG